MDEDYLIIKDENGNDVYYDILFTFDSDETGKSYVAYTNHKKNEKGNVEVYTSCYDTYAENPVLVDIKTKEELNTVEEILNTIDFND